MALACLPACSSLSERDEKPETRFLGEGGVNWFGGSGSPKPTTIDGSSGSRQRAGYLDPATTSSYSVNPTATRGAALSDDGQRFSVNFVDTEVQEFIRVVFEEILRANVVVDPSVTGQITVRTAAPVSKSVALDLAKSVLAPKGASIALVDGVYRVSKGSEPGSSTATSRVIRVVPLQFLNAEQAKSALQSFSGDPARIAALPGGRTLVLSGAEADLERYEQVLLSLDTDEMRQRSFALVPLQDAGAAAVSRELNAMFRSEDGKAFQAMPVERMNAVLILGRSNATIARARDWVRRLDQAGQDERKVHVYPIQNRRASDLADILQQMMGSNRAVSTSTVAPGLPAAVAIASASEGGGGGSAADMTANGTGGLASQSATGIAISADPATNSLVIVATPDDYRVIERAIRRLDIMPTQVLIEATIAEVTLNKNLSHGVRWYFENGNHSVMLAGKNGIVPGPIAPGFNYVFSVPGGRAVIDALEELTKVEIISSPALTVLDNQTASLKVGDQVPIATRSSRSVTDPDAPVVNDIQLKDTGVILSVKPRVNANGLVQLDISQEISDVVPTTTSAIDSPTIRQRAVTSSVVVQSGTEIALGGMIATKRERTRSGVPLLKDIPIVGEAFTSSATKDRGRTELLILIRPVVLANNADVSAITQEIRSRMMEASSN